MKKALIFYGGWDGHTPRETAELFRDLLMAEDFQVTMYDTLEVLNDYESLRQYDLFVPVWTMGKLSWEAEQNICRAVAEGAGIAGCHGGMCDSFRESTDWQFMTGSQWVAHPGNDQAVYTVVLDKEAPLTCDLEDFSLQSEQYYIHVDPAVKVWATTRFPVFPGNHSPNGEIDLPVVYTKFWGMGKVYYNSLGHTYKVFQDIPQARELMRRGFLWAAR